MYKKVLVDEMIEDGNTLLQALKRNRLPIAAAAWYDIPESGWSLVIVSSAVDRKGPLAAYTRVQRALQAVQPSRLTLSDVTLTSPQSLSQDFQNLRPLLTAPRRGGRPSAPRPSRNLVFDDAYVYQV